MRQFALSAILAGIIWVGLHNAVLAGSETVPSRVSGSYTISLSGIKIGNFQFNAASENSDYRLSGSGRISAFFGVLLWQGKARSEGKHSASTISPARYQFDWRASKKKHGTLKMHFRSGRIEAIEMQPPSHPSPEVIPVRPQHLENVIDPLSALLSLGISNGTQPCDKKIAVFDGKLRFDLALRFSRHERLAPTTNKGPATEQAIVCQVKFTPVAGHKNDKTMKAITEARGVEIWYRSVATANLLVPQEVRVPTFAGNVVVQAKRIEFVSAGKRQIALVN